MSRSKPFLSLLVTEPIAGLEDVITEIPLDAKISTTHIFGSSITEFPVESGSSITDHVHLAPVQLSIEGYVSDSPISILPTTMTAMKGDVGDGNKYSYSKNAFDILMLVYKSKTPLTVIDRLETYQNMMIERLEIPQSRDRGQGLWFTMSLRQISIASTLSAALPVDIVAGLKRNRKKTVVTVAADRKSIDQTSVLLDNGKQSTKTVDASTSSTALATTTELNTSVKRPSP